VNKGEGTSLENSGLVQKQSEDSSS